MYTCEQNFKAVYVETPHSLHGHSMATNTSMSQGKLRRDLGMCILLASVVGSPHLLPLFVCAARYIHVHVYKPTLRP